MPDLPGIDQIDVEYDAVSQLTREALIGGWGAQEYQYDQAGNRVQTIDNEYQEIHQFAYGTGNRETLGPNGTLQYDYKGNVTTRPALSGLTYQYAWDAYDRLKTAQPTAPPVWSGPVIQFDYDALGRLLKRASDATGTTVNYWLGLNKIAEERWSGDSAAGSTIFRPDDESTATPEEAGWGVTSDSFGTVAMAYTEDQSRGLVMRLTSDDATSDLTARAMLGDAQANNLNANDLPWGDAGRRQLALWVRNANIGGRLGVRAIVQSEAGKRTLQFLTQTGTDVLAAPNWGNYFLGTQQNDGNWHYLEIDLQARFDQFWPGETLQTVDAVWLLGLDLYVDDIVLSGGKLEKSYAPGYLGAQAGREAGRAGVDWDQWHYQFNDLGTVLATTDANGLKIGVYQPDAFGNERLVDGLRPDGLMLTGKFRDAEAGLIYFGYRWYDAERGRWMSEEPLGLDGPNLYHYVFNNPINFMDSNGLSTTIIGIEGGLCPDIGVGGALGFYFDWETKTLGIVHDMGIGIGGYLSGTIGITQVFGGSFDKPSLCVGPDLKAAVTPARVGISAGAAGDFANPATTYFAVSAGVGPSAGAFLSGRFTFIRPLCQFSAAPVPAPRPLKEKCSIQCRAYPEPLKNRYCMQDCMNNGARPNRRPIF